jgi:hypothetical protein
VDGKPDDGVHHGLGGGEDRRFAGKRRNQGFQPHPLAFSDQERNGPRLGTPEERTKHNLALCDEAPFPAHEVAFADLPVVGDARILGVCDLLDRSAFYYNQFNSDSKTKANDYFDALKDDFLKENVANRDGIGGIGGDDPSTLPVFWDKPAQRQSDDGDGYASGWADTRQGTASNGRPNNKYPWEQ